MNIYLIRHPKPDIGEGICYGEMDLPPVKEHLQEVIEYVQEKLPLESLIAYSSPLQRARLVAEGLDLPHTLVPAIAEMGFGEWEGQHWGNLPKDELTAWGSDFMNYADHGGESVAGFLKRVTGFIDDTLLSQNRDAVLFTHAGVIRSFLHYTGDVSIERGNHLELNYGSITHLIFQGDTLSAKEINITE